MLSFMPTVCGSISLITGYNCLYEDIVQSKEAAEGNVTSSIKKRPRQEPEISSFKGIKITVWNHPLMREVIPVAPFKLPLFYMVSDINF